MNVSEPNTLIPYYTAYLIHYFYNSKARGDRNKRTSDSDSVSKNTPEDKTFFFTLTLLDPSISNFNENKPTPYLYTKL